jgi:hypothetical protein
VGRGNKNIRRIFDIRIWGQTYTLHDTAHFENLLTAAAPKFNYFVLRKRHQALKLETA